MKAADHTVLEHIPISCDNRQGLKSSRELLGSGQSTGSICYTMPMIESDTLLQHFVDRLLNIDPTRLNLFGSGYPGFQGSTAIVGASGSAAEVIGKLRRATMAFANEYRQESPQRANLLKAAEYIEAPLTVLQTLGIINDTDTEATLNEMHNLIDYRTPA